MSGAAVRVESVSVRLGGSDVLSDVDLCVDAGSLVALLGPSGCGKTTLLRVVAGLQPADRGRVLIGGSDVTERPARSRSVGFVFQSYGLFPTMTARGNVAFPLRVAGRAGGEVEDRVDELLRLVGMEDFGGRRPSQLSGGQQQRVALARAIAREPDVLLLDEPLSALDAVIRESLRDEIRLLQRRLGLTVVHVTHDQSEAMAMADQIAVMREGRIVEVGPPEELYRRPRSSFTARFVGSRNEVPVEPRPSGGVCWNDALVLPDADPRTRSVLFPPEAVAVATHGPGEPALVRLGVFQGATVRLQLEVAGSTIVADRPAADASGFAPGQSCFVRVDPRAVTAVTDDDAVDLTSHPTTRPTPTGRQT